MMATNQIESSVTLGTNNVESTLSTATTEYAIAQQVAEFDEQIADYTAELNATVAQKAEIRSAQGVIDGYVAKPVKTDEDGNEIISLNYVEVKELIELCEANGIDPGITVNENFGIQISKEQLDKIKTSLENKLTSLNDSSEIKMIKFQSLMDARKQALLMLSNMVSSGNQTIMEIIRNMKS